VHKVATYVALGILSLQSIRLKNVYYGNTGRDRYIPPYCYEASYQMLVLSISLSSAWLVHVASTL
jgi:hypothetical protein